MRARHASYKTTRMSPRESTTAPSGLAHRPAGPLESARANRTWWDASAASYQDEHGEFLGDCDLLWCPEGLRESDARLLGEVAGRDVLEVGCGAGL